ncbi:MAG: cytochrome c maturation protein CcmE [Gemmatimonadaceae bacterium]
MNARTRFFVAALAVVLPAGFLMASSIKQTGVYYLTPSELETKVRNDTTLYETGVKVGGAHVIPGSIVRDEGGRSMSFRVTDGTTAYPVTYRGIAPDTFTDSVEVVLEGGLQRDGTFRATTVLAKCASRYENAPDADEYRDIREFPAEPTGAGA